MRVRSVIRVVGYTSVSSLAGVLAAGAAADADTGVMGTLNRRGRNPIPVLLLVGAPLAGLSLALRRNRRSA